MKARLESVKQRIQLLSVIDTDRQLFGANRHRYQLGPTLTADELGALQSSLGTDLPDEVCAFLREVGSQGAGPYYGLRFAVGAVDGDEIPRGMVFIADQGCGMKSYLVVSGQHRGEVWIDNGVGYDLEREAIGFLAWYEAWIDRALIEWAEKAAPRIAIDGPESPEELEAAMLAFDLLAALKRPTSGQAGALGYLHLRERRFDDADAAFVTASRAAYPHGDLLHSERAARLHRDRANIAYVRDDHATAIDLAHAGLRINSIWFSTADELREILERALHATGNADEALAVLEERAAGAYFDYRLHHRLATEHLARGNVPAAIAALERAANMPNIGGDGSTLDTRVTASFQPIITALRAGGRRTEAEALESRVDVLLNAN
jgi:hypothetical protein